MSLLVVGSIAYDSIQTDSGSVENVLGGSAIHFSAASSFFAPTGIVGVVGEDFRKDELKFLIERNVDVSGIVTESGRTFRWSGRYHADMNERDTLSTELNVFEHFKPRIPESYKDSEYIFLANINPGLQLEVLRQVHNPRFAALDTMNFWIEGSRSELLAVLKKVDAVILNDTEAQQFCGEHNLVKAAKAMALHGPRIVVIKKGEHGSILFHDSSFFVLPAFLLESVIDPTGAGDSFAGGFIGYLAQQKKLDNGTLRQAVAYGTCMASFCCEGFGTDRLAAVDKEDYTGRFIEFQKLVNF
ncbi:sugar kinase [bacterium SM23_31]|nr:MAG: sugar kinase [bacterium SM23_31]